MGKSGETWWVPSFLGGDERFKILVMVAQLCETLNLPNYIL